MISKRWWVTIIGAIAIAAASYGITSAIYSQQLNARFSPGMGCSMTPIISYLQLTPEQQRRITPIDEKFRANQQATCTEMQDTRARLLDVLKKSNATQAELDSALADVSNVQAKLQRMVAEYILEIKPILTDEQKDNLFDLVGQKFCGQGRCGAGFCPAGGGPGRNGRCGRTQ